jgi:hypothetical protein
MSRLTKSLKIMYRITWLSTLLFSMNVARHRLSKNVDDSEWDTLYPTIKVTLNALLAVWLLWTTRKSKSLEGNLGWTVGWITLFLIDWSAYAKGLSATLNTMSLQSIMGWGVLFASLAWIASALTNGSLRNR